MSGSITNGVVGLDTGGSGCARAISPIVFPVFGSASGSCSPVLALTARSETGTLEPSAATILIVPDGCGLDVDDDCGTGVGGLVPDESLLSGRLLVSDDGGLTVGVLDLATRARSVRPSGRATNRTALDDCRCDDPL